MKATAWHISIQVSTKPFFGDGNILNGNTFVMKDHYYWIRIFYSEFFMSYSALSNNCCVKHAHTYTHTPTFYTKNVVEVEVELFIQNPLQLRAG